MDTDCFDTVSYNYWNNYHLEYLMLLPPALQLAVWTQAPKKFWAQSIEYLGHECVSKMLAIHDTAILTSFYQVLPYNETHLVNVCLQIEDVRLIDYFIKAFTRKKQREHAQQWFTSHPKTALTALLPLIFSDKVTATKKETLLNILIYMQDNIATFDDVMPKVIKKLMIQNCIKHQRAGKLNFDKVQTIVNVLKSNCVN